MKHGSPVDRPVKSSATSAMVSAPHGAHPRGRGLGRAWAFSAFAVATACAISTGCNASECLREDCLTSAPTDATVGAGGALAVQQSCTTNGQCRSAQGEACVSGACRTACTSHFDCQGRGQCVSGTDSEGSTSHYCQAGEPQKSGQFYTHCPSGAECDTAAGFFCVSAGAADLDSYCTSDCTDDGSCAKGYACTALIRNPCQDICGFKGDPKDRSCIPSEQVGDGKPYRCGTRGVTRSACRPRKFCSPCESDADCLASPSQVCAADRSGTKTCTQLCDLEHPSCPWGSAASCGLWDRELGLATCAHRFGKCTGSGKGCEPCQSDVDCGLTGVCTASNFTGERWCVDLSVHCSCASASASSGLCSGGGCPQSPSGLAMLCLDSTPDVASSGVCAGANTNNSVGSSTSQQSGCWPAN